MSKYKVVDTKEAILAAWKKYTNSDTKTISDVFNTLNEKQKNAVYFTIAYNENRISKLLPKIKDVIYNDPATIVFWEDGTKTVVKCKNEKFDPEKGLAMAFSKKMLGNKGNYYNIFKKWLPEEKSRNDAIPIFNKWRHKK